MNYIDKYKILLDVPYDDRTANEDIFLEGVENGFFDDNSEFAKRLAEDGRTLNGCYEDLTDDDFDILGALNFAKRDREYEETKKQQRGERGYADTDAWNIYAWFLEVMPKALQKMRDNLHGYPELDYNSMPESQVVEIDEEEDSPGMKKWKEILDRMIFLLHEMDEDTCSFTNPYVDEYLSANEEFEKKYGVFGTDFEEINHIERKGPGKRVYFIKDDPDHPEWKELSDNYTSFERNIAAYRDRCREEFFNLFSTHFWNLWD